LAYKERVPISRDTVSRLAPPELDNLRSLRYRGDDQAIELRQLKDADRALLVELYAFLGELAAVVSPAPALVEPAPLLELLGRHPIASLIQRARRLGADATDLGTAEMLHDIRGGALTVLFVQLARLGRVPYRPELAASIAITTRDHMKIMRNLAVDLDPPARARDLAFLHHSLGDLAAALREFTAPVGEARLSVEVDCADDAVIAESCVECGAIDRVAYNLLNNAARYASEPSVRVWLLRLEKDLRVAVANAVEPAQRARLEERLGADPAALFGEFTTSGSGYGLQIVAELVGRAYGVTSTTSLVGGRYVGASLFDHTFVAWFHWPLVDP
jgi:signal transduction histidine kinase